MLIGFAYRGPSVAAGSVESAIGERKRAVPNSGSKAISQLMVALCGTARLWLWYPN
jgi:hypothetical protein